MPLDVSVGLFFCSGVGWTACADPLRKYRDAENEILAYPLLFFLFIKQNSSKQHPVKSHKIRVGF